MCGIAGVAHADRTRHVELSRLHGMASVLQHRGPDDAGYHIDGAVGLAHRRLSIIDVAGGHQPIANEDHAVWITCNGEIYNYRDHRTQLQSRGHHFRTRSDSEVILHLYEEHGIEAFRQLGGMFAVALWDARQRRLVLARDRLGIKPLYYHIGGDGDLAWGSEIKAVLAGARLRPQLRLASLPEYLANRANAGRHTLFEGVKRVQPGHCLVWQDGEVSELPYWRLADALGREVLAGGARELTAQFAHRFSEAVASHLVSDVPVGVFLSGGLDSSAVASLMRDHVGERLRTFSVGYDDASASELRFASQMARHLGSEHQEVVVSADAFFGALPRLVWHEDEPIAFPSSVSLYFVASLASASVKVVLSGEGSDELLGGYPKYVRTLRNLALGGRYEQLPDTIRRTIRSIIGRLPQEKRTVRRLGRTFLTRAVDPEALYFDNFGAYFHGEVARLLAPEVAADSALRNADPFALQRELWAQSAGSTPLTRMLYVDMSTYLHELLMKQDQMSMAASIESRVPFLDTDLVELAFRMPDAAKVQGSRTKVVLREMMRERLPRTILDRPKVGFSTPVGRWLATTHWSWVEEYVLDPGRLTAPLFDAAYTRLLAMQHRRGVFDHTERLWPLINLELWARTYPGVLDQA